MHFISPAFNTLKKKTKIKLDTKVIKVAILADSASQLVNIAIKGFGIQENINYEIFESDYNQIERQIFDATSDLYAFQPDYVIILLSTEKLVKKFYKLDKEGQTSFAVLEIDKINNLYQALESGLSCKVILNNFIELNDAVFGNFDSKTKLSFPYQVKKLNLLLMEYSQVQLNLNILDLHGLVNKLGYNFTFDPKIYYSSDMVFSIGFLPYYAKHINDIIKASEGIFKKCLILDLDNTLWGGIIGDDGMEGIQIGDLGIGKVFTDLQMWIKQLQQRGIILAICSKNTENIAKEPFLNHKDMVLKIQDIAIFVANWENKSENIRHIQSILNVGMDSIVFVDDNPFERELVKKELPEITVPDLPEDPAEYLLYLQSLNLFETNFFTTEDLVRTQQYQEEFTRITLLPNFSNEDDFLSSLEMVSEVKSFNSFNIPRVSQLSHRSNQFNLRTVRYTEEQLKEMTKIDAFKSFSFGLKDKYGDNGLIAFVIIKVIDANSLFIENWAMSCRVLKRGMEAFILNHIVKDALRNGYKTLVGEYIPTLKNKIVEDHYEKLGFMKDIDNKYFLTLENFHFAKTNIK